jgi:hypothetical protein
MTGLPTDRYIGRNRAEGNQITIEAFVNDAAAAEAPDAGCSQGGITQITTSFDLGQNLNLKWNIDFSTNPLFGRNFSDCMLAGDSRMSHR